MATIAKPAILKQAKRKRKLTTTSQTTTKSFKVGKQTIIVGNCLEELDKLAANSVDVCVTSPPYNIGIKYNAYKDILNKADYLYWLNTVAQKLFRVLKDDGALFLNVGSTSVNPWLANEVAQQFVHSFKLQNHIAWIKSISIGDDTYGHFKPINSQRFLNNNFESIFHFTKGGNNDINRLSIGVPFKDKTNIKRWGHSRDTRCGGNVWFLPYNTVRTKAEKFDHPAGYPIELPKRCLLMHGKRKAVVLDPFLGAGTTLVAAHRLGMKGIGFEIDPTYANIAAKRLQDELNNDNTKATGKLR